MAALGKADLGSGPDRQDHLALPGPLWGTPPAVLMGGLGTVFA